MATYAVGDIQGCFSQLEALLEQIGFGSDDSLWLAGDLVNRGPESLQVLRFARDLGERLVAVLGNHDLHLLAAWFGRHRHFKTNDTLEQVLAAPDRDTLLEWLRHRPLMHYDAELDYAMVHAGLPPQWNRDTALACAAEVEQVLRGPQMESFMANMYGNRPALWDPALTGWERLRFSVNCFSRLRFCHPDGTLDFHHKGSIEEAGPEVVPWFRAPERRNRDLRILFGHWSTLGYYHGENVHALDSGCLWGGQLTALRLDDGKVFQLQCPQVRKPKR